MPLYPFSFKEKAMFKLAYHNEALALGLGNESNLPKDTKARVKAEVIKKILANRKEKLQQKNDENITTDNDNGYKWQPHRRR